MEHHPACPDVAWQAGRRATPHLGLVADILAVAAVLAAAAMAPHAASATTWIVEAGCDPPIDDCDCDAIQPCMDLAAAGDTVLVRAGVYRNRQTRTIDIGGQPYTITANVFLRDGVHLVGEEPGHDRQPAAVIDAGGLGIGLLADRVGATTRVEHLTVRNGDASGTSFNGVGGGMLLVAAAPTITGCVFEQNRAKQGGALACELESSPIVTGNVFSDNAAALDGGAILCALGAAVVTDNLFEGNTAAQGAAVSYVAAGRLAGNLFRSNQGTDFLAQIAVQDGRDTGPTLVVEQNVFHDNSSAIFLTTNPLTVLRANTMVLGAAGIDGRDVLDTVEIESNLIVSQVGAGIAWRGAGPPPALLCNDVWQNGVDYVGLDDPTGTDGNIAADPLHCDPVLGEFHLAANSPCSADSSACATPIGALPVGCDPSPVERRSWGAIKAGYR
jgi:predicted outer membrane repeat protein